MMLNWICDHSLKIVVIKQYNKVNIIYMELLNIMVI